MPACSPCPSPPKTPFCGLATLVNTTKITAAYPRPDRAATVDRCGWSGASTGRQSPSPSATAPQSSDQTAPRRRAAARPAPRRTVSADRAPRTAGHAPRVRSPAPPRHGSEQPSRRSSDTFPAIRSPLQFSPFGIPLSRLSRSRPKASGSDTPLIRFSPKGDNRRGDADGSISCFLDAAPSGSGERSEKSAGEPKTRSPRGTRRGRRAHIVSAVTISLQSQALNMDAHPAGTAGFWNRFG